MRLWIASSDYQGDVRLSDKIIKQMSDVYRKIRNTYRYLLSNLYDFDVEKDAIPYNEMEEIDKWALLRLEQVRDQVTKAYKNYEFHVMYHVIHNFCTVDMSAIYLDILKDKLYEEVPNSKERRSAQTAIHEILVTLTKLMAPVLAFTTEEVWQAMKHTSKDEKSVHLENWPEAKPEYLDEKLEEKWNKRLALRGEITKALEEKRKLKEIGHSLDADVTVYAKGEAYDTLVEMEKELADFCIVSTIKVETSDDEELKVDVKISTREKCERCWKHLPSVGNDEKHPTVCARCSRVLKEMGL